MTCPKCAGDTKVVDSRLNTATGHKPRNREITAEFLRRRRCCLLCDYRFTTYETLAKEGVEPRLDNIESVLENLVNIAKAAYCFDQLREIDSLLSLLGITRKSLCLQVGVSEGYLSKALIEGTLDPDQRTIAAMQTIIVAECAESFRQGRRSNVPVETVTVPTSSDD